MTIKFRIGFIKQVLLFLRIILVYVGIYAYSFFTKKEISPFAYQVVFAGLFIIDSLPAKLLRSWRMNNGYIFFKEDIPPG